VEIPTILPTVGEPVSTDLLNLDALEDASFGEKLHAATILTKMLSEQIADRQTYHEIATFRDVEGADWSGFHGAPEHSEAESQKQSNEATARKTTQTPPPAPTAPDNYCDTLPAIGHMLSQLARFQEASLVHYSRYLEASMNDQRSYLGTPYRDSHFRDPAQYLVEIMRISRHSARKIVKRGVYYAYRPGTPQQHKDAQPIFKGLAESLASGKLPLENADKIIDLDEDLTKYSNKTKQPLARKDQVLQAFEPTMVEAGEAATPDELSKAKHRWLVHTAHWVCQDGPSPSQVLVKEADNELRMREHADGSATYSMHASADASVAFKNFMLHQLKFNGSPVRISDKVFNLLTTFKKSKDYNRPSNEAADSRCPSQTPSQASDTSEQKTPRRSTDLRQDAGQQAKKHNSSDEPLPSGKKEHTAGEILGPIETWDTSPDMESVVAEDAAGDPVRARQIDRLDHMTTGQRMGLILVSLMSNMVALDPAVLGAKKAHGASARLMIVQDIETAYHTLGVGKIPEAARRPRGPDGLLPAVIKRPNPSDSGDSHLHGPSPIPDNSEVGRQVPWTPFQSEAVNIGPIHPDDAAPLICNSDLVGHIWDGPDTVLQEKRAKRLFTSAQRRAILARDKGCQAPGCTIPAVNCAIHHIKEWFEGGNTDETNAVTLCPRHHAAVHNGKWVIRKHHGLTFFQPAPWLDPTQPLLRNIYWNT